MHNQMNLGCSPRVWGTLYWILKMAVGLHTHTLFLQLERLRYGSAKEEGFYAWGG